MPASVTLSVSATGDIARARRATRELLTRLSFNKGQTEGVVLAVAELSTNLVRYGDAGEITLTEIRDDDRAGVRVESRDHGPGISNLEDALRDGFSTGGGLGGGLPAVRRLMDEFDISSSASGTTIVTCKWLTKQQ